MIYTSKFVSGSLNKPFWKEVLIGRRIVSLAWNRNKIKSMQLDSGQIVTFDPTAKYSFMINTNTKIIYKKRATSNK